MKRVALVALCCALFPAISSASQFARSLCGNPQFHCHQVRWGDTWWSLFRNVNEMQLVKKINRKNTSLRPGMVIAIPRNLGQVNAMQFAPMPQTSEIADSIKVDLRELAWGAYDGSGKLINWGPISGGSTFCSDIKGRCHTVTGTYTIYQKKGEDCVSNKFPIPKGGAPMPYCMHFHGGYALHGSGLLPGENASHGCVRMMLQDAKWLNQSFVKVGKTKVTVTN